jgi:hypothetical protein
MQQTLARLRAEFIEMPDLRLTVKQAQKLCGVVDPSMCQALLDALVDARFLRLRPDGTYARVADSEAAGLPRRKAS